MKTLIVIAHPSIESSIINKRWLEELRKHPEEVTIHEIYKEYPDEKIDIQREQELIEAHDNLILQFPVYWFNCPPFLKKWLDEVLADGWAYGKGGDKLKDKKISLAVTAGIKSEDYSSTGRYNYTLSEVLRPFEVTILYTHADYRPFYAFYGAEHSPLDQEVDLSAQEYIHFINSL
ncbi:NAD(P)H oxidoreductase [Bacillus sp. FJAT-27264]|uniref:NAD(P)H-dependent oxidoreductase n=1 Tax=Paenibacillus sp. (strain DSM 101736 / FJAT-27264) TaxID=1850362 RepID=UPI0008080C1B|nr:NAD(P)H-dependent oxidoreductase [Bacillus sp. FJAT-27264]OBZ14746.1 NAD(P)H oxidoreductase [Bacillus sp. FJAT-27264]